MSFNCDKYQELAIFLDDLLNNVTTGKLDGGELQLYLIKLQEFFLREIVPLTDIGHHEQSYQTEMSKQLRLLEVDVMFLQGAKQSTTIQMRLKNIEERLNTLLRYCTAIIDSDK